jgi:succinoglycan biosynthesis transport protein ExoP
MSQERTTLAMMTREAAASERNIRTTRPFSEVDAFEAYSSFRSYKTILFKRRWQILLVALAVSVLVATTSMLTTPQYRATARILVAPDNSELRTIDDIFRNSSANDDNFLATQVNVLQSDNLAWQTIEQLRLRELVEFTKDAESRSESTTSVVGNKANVIEAFRSRLMVDRKRDTRMIEVSFDSSDPALSARVANALVNNYVEYNFQMKFNAARQTTVWMQKQLGELKDRVQQSQQALVDYERHNSIVDLGNKESVAEQKLEDLSRNLTQAQSDRMERESLFALANSTKSQVGVTAENDLLQKLEEKDAELREQYADALAQYGEAFPKVVRLKGQIDELQILIERAKKRMIEHFRNNFDVSKARETLLASAVAKQRAEVENFNQLLIQHNILKHDFEANQQLYESLLQRHKDATVSAGLRATNIHVVDEAVPSAAPVRPRKLHNSLIGLLAGLILGVLVAMVMEGLDNSVKSAEDVERLIAAPVLADIPRQNGFRRLAFCRTPSALESSESKQNSLPKLSLLASVRQVLPRDAVELTVLHEPWSPISEAFRALRTSVLFSSLIQPPKTMLVTSALPMEGKTSVSLNLALALAQKGSATSIRPQGTYVGNIAPGRVLLADADFRRPGITRLLGLTDEPGLSSVLFDGKSLEECIRPLDAQMNLWVLPTGPLPPNPTELLSSPSMDLLLQLMREQFGHVIVDSPPVLLVTDATILSNLVDGVIMVVEMEQTSRDAVMRACRVVMNSGGRILGAALNKVDARGGNYYGHYYSKR